MELRLWVGNPYLIHFTWSALLAELQKLFDPVVERSKKYNKFVPQNRKTKPNVMPNDLLVYLVPTYEHGFIGRGFGPDGSQADRRTGGQNRSYDGKTCSEVYVANQIENHSSSAVLRVDWMDEKLRNMRVELIRSPRHVAKLIFHEILHNQTGYDDAKLHKHDGLRSEVIMESTPLTDNNVKLMASVIDDRFVRPQWNEAWHLEKFQ